jgi:hypothetical protein
MVEATIPFVALVQVFDGTVAVTNGILRARGKQVSELGDPFRGF